jgi:integrase
MASAGVIFKRCGCRDQDTGRRLDQACPELSGRGHGSWYFDCSAPDLLGRSERKRQGGFTSKTAARQEMADWLAQTKERRTAHGWTLARWFRHWLATRTRIRPTTRLHYFRDVDLFLIPFLGDICLAELDYHRLADGFDRIAASTNGHGRRVSPSTLQHLRTTLRSALNLAVRQGVLADNPARRLHVPGAGQAFAQVWTERRVQRWRATGQRPSVGVWTVAQLADFLNTVAADQLFALWWLVALRGLRRGEAAGLRWSDIDFEHAQMYIVNNRTTAGHQVIEGPPKSASGVRVVALDRRSVAVLREHLRQQLKQRDTRLAAGKDWYESGYLFTCPDGRPVHPGYLTQRFRTLVRRADVPPIRLHDLRHGAASLAHEAGADLKTVQDQLGHHSIVTTADIYSSVLPDTQRKTAENTARLVLDAARLTRQKIKAKVRRNRAPVPEIGAPASVGLAGTHKRRSKAIRKRRRHRR